MHAVKTGGTSGQANFVQKLIPESPTSSANYGESVSISDGMIAVGSPGVSEVLVLFLDPGVCLG